MLRVTLVLEKKKRVLRRVDLRRPRTVVGRQLGCDLRLPSAEVSRRHCLLLIGDNDLYIEDMNSVNGTYVNDVAAIGRQQVNPGDRLQIGPFTFVVEFAPLPLDFDPDRPRPARKRAPVEHAKPPGNKARTSSASPDKSDDLFPGEYVSRAERGDSAERLDEVAEEAEELEVVSDESEVVSGESEEVVEDVEVVLDDDEPLTLPANAELRGILTELAESDRPTKPANP
jgi:pSer/pThr/pTyr-binding forkhead associated (FHA) protein